MPEKTLERETRTACPHCGAPVDAGDARPSIGEPFAICAQCGGYVTREGANEWVLLRPGVKLDLVARGALRAIVLGAIPALLHQGFALVTDRDVRRGEALVVLAIGWLFVGALEAARLVSAIGRSRRRMRDPMYRAKLVESKLPATSQH